MLVRPLFGIEDIAYSKLFQSKKVGKLLQFAPYFELKSSILISLFAGGYFRDSCAIRLDPIVLYCFLNNEMLKADC